MVLCCCACVGPDCLLGRAGYVPLVANFRPRDELDRDRLHAPYHLNEFMQQVVDRSCGASSVVMKSHRELGIVASKCWGMWLLKRKL
jgi:hypothetical protein